VDLVSDPEARTGRRTHMKARRAFDLINGCVIHAMRSLLGDDDWSSQEIFERIEENDENGGLPGSDFHLLSDHAPVKVWNAFSINGYDDHIEIDDKKGGKTQLNNDERITIIYKTRRERAHAETIKVSELENYQHHEISTIVTKREEKDVVSGQVYCFSCGYSHVAPSCD